MCRVSYPEVSELTRMVLDRQPLYVIAEDEAVCSMLTAHTAWALHPKSCRILDHPPYVQAVIMTE